ncbi:ABC transporter substrate-binding protein [Streptomyces sp. HNM0574]|uniref:ABC transporter substrate-binding protein n=1 Tax=Streptomyces sp. HNM0574 TaxID=2714954 RepID=UPI00146F48BC|nr:ABC transporter substrate-binding protein [Streptomyces sp. HNM0574]NLU68459.1 ABC transporter substrate-binding protein [Streptomyces sp. HNM0574]
MAAAVLAPLAACGGPAPGEAREKPGKAAEGFPYTVTNCGVETTYQRPPERAVTLNQHATEVLLALGLEDRIAGTAYLDDKVLPRYEKAYRGLKVLAKRYPSLETLLGADPDFVYGGYSSAFDRTQGRDRASLEKSGVRTRLNVEQCAEGRVGVAQLRQEIRETARTFGVPERGEKLLARYDRELASVRKRTEGQERPSVFVYDSGDGSAFTAGGKGIGDDIIERAGGRNVFSGIRKPFADVSWEQVVQRKPEVVLIYDYGGTPVEAKKRKLLSDPALRDVPAVRNKRFAVLPLSSAVLGVRAPAAVGELAEQLHPAEG